MCLQASQGYARHAPTMINVTSTHNISYATYSDIRFAQPPIGDLRFKGPQTPPPYTEGVQDGVVPRNSTNCLQAIPWYFPLPGSEGASWGSEDCLFLDVIVPEGVKHGDSVPVVHWIYGGGVSGVLGHHDESTAHSKSSISSGQKTPATTMVHSSTI